MKKTVLSNTLGIRLPEVSMIPGEYNEHLSFTAGYYVTEKDYAARKAARQAKRAGNKK